MLKDSHIHAFTSHKIILVFAASGMHPLDTSKVLGVARPAPFHNPNLMLTPQQMVEMMKRKRREVLIGKSLRGCCASWKEFHTRRLASHV